MTTHTTSLDSTAAAFGQTESAPPFWSARWGYPQALTLAIMLVGSSLVVQARFPDVAVDLPAGAGGWIAVFGPLVLVGAGRLLWPSQPILAGIGGIPMAVVSVLAMAILSIPGAIWPQGEQAPGWAHRFGFDHVFTSFPMAAASGLVLLNLASCTARRLTGRTLLDARFFLIHAGLMLAMGAALVGSAQLQRVRLPLQEGAGFLSVGLLDNERYQLPFAISLEDFRMTTYPPGLALARKLASPDDGWQVDAGNVFIEKGAVEILDDYRIDVLDLIPRAGVVGGIPRAFPQEGAGPAALVRVTQAGMVVGEGWLHASSVYGEELFMQISDEHVLLLQAPRPKTYESQVLLTSEDGERTATIGVNTPLRHEGWTIYQLDYDASSGEASRLSVLEAVRDPAYPIVALGCWLAILGCIWFFWDAAKATVSAREEEVSA